MTAFHDVNGRADRAPLDIMAPQARRIAVILVKRSASIIQGCALKCAEPHTERVATTIFNVDSCFNRQSVHDRRGSLR
jgi:exoribonuclease II